MHPFLQQVTPDQIVDFHAHIYPEKIAQKASQSIGDFYGLTMNNCGTVERLLSSAREGGVGRVVVQSVATTPHQVQSINNFISEQCKLHPGELIGLGTIHPDMEDPIAELKRFPSLGLHGVKIHPDVQRFDMDCPKMMPLYRWLQGKMPLLIHCGDYRYGYSHPARLAHILDEFPQLVVVGAHFGGWSLWDLALEYLKDRQCYLDTSSSFAFLGKTRSKELIRAYGAQRIVFGVDFPMWNHKQELETLFSLGLEENEYRLILKSNAEKILGLSL